MEIEQGVEPPNDPVTSSISKRSLFLHPLVITTVCDHHTRVIMGGTPLAVDSPVVGLLFGVQENLAASIYDATEAIYEVHSGHVMLNMDAILKKKALWNAVYPAYELLGWYTVAFEVSAEHVLLHKAIMELNISPLFLMLKPTIEPDSKQLPITLHELRIQRDYDTHLETLEELPYKLSSSLVERIAIDEVVKSTPSDGCSVVEVQNQAFLVSLRAIVCHVDEITAELRKMLSGERPVDFTFLRQLATLCQQLPPKASTSELFHSSQMEDANALIVAALAMINRNVLCMGELHDTYKNVFGEKARKGNV